MSQIKVNRFIELFDLKTEGFVERIRLPEDLDLDALRQLYHKKSTDLDYFYMDGYNITENEREFFEKLISRKIDLSKYCYQLVSEKA